MSKKFKIPNILRSMRDHKHDEDWDNHFAALEAAPRHAKHLSKAEESLADARDFCETLRGHQIEEEAYTEVTVVERIEKLICKTRDRLDRHGTAHTNLFIAYFDLKGGAL